MRTTIAAKVAEQFLNAWAQRYGTPTYLLTDNGPRAVAKFFEVVYLMLAVRHLVTTAYHPQINGEAESFNRTLATRSRHYVSEHQSDWADF